jgi:uroporphyrinogen-III synthase
VSVKSILVSQPKPKTDKTPFSDLAQQYNLNIDYIPFIYVEGVDSKEFRSDRIDLSNYSAVIFTSRMAIDHYFRIAREMRFAVPDDMKYFCISEAVAYYLQNYIVYRKRKIFFGKLTIQDLMTHINKHGSEKFLVPCSNIQRKNIPEELNKHEIDFQNAILYKTLCSDLSDLSDVKYDILVFYSPSGIQSLLENFPKFKQNKTRIATFGSTTAQAAEDNGLRIDIKAPMPGIPSMTMAIEKYINDKKNK